MLSKSALTLSSADFHSKSTINPARSRKWRHGELCSNQSPLQTPLQIASGTETYHALEKSSQLILKTFNALCVVESASGIDGRCWNTLQVADTLLEAAHLLHLWRTDVWAKIFCWLDRLALHFFHVKIKRDEFCGYSCDIYLCLWNSTSKFNSVALKLIAS